MKKETYNPIPFKETDERIFIVRFQTGLISSIEQDFTQLDLLQIMKHIKGRNDRLYFLLKDLILDVDHATQRKTDFKRKLPQRRYNGEF